jgi:hypothetical protein
MAIDARPHSEVNQTNIDYWRNTPENIAKREEATYGINAKPLGPQGQYSSAQMADKLNAANKFYSKFGQYPTGQTDHINTTINELNTNGANMYQSGNYLQSLAYDPTLNDVGALPTTPSIPTFGEIPVENRGLEPHTDKSTGINPFQYQSDLNLDTELDQGQTEYQYQDKLGNSLMKAAPAAYNLFRGLFDKGDKKSKENYYDPINAPKYDISEAQKALGRNYAGYLKALGKTGYQTKALAGYQAKNIADAKLNEKKQNIDAQNQFRADAQNQQAAFRAQVTADQWNRMDDNQKREYLDTAMTQIGQMGASSQADELGMLYANMMSPDFKFSKKGTFDNLKKKK